MKIPILIALWAACFLSAGCQHGPPLSKEQERRYGEMLSSGKVRTEFARGAKLASWQLAEVLGVAGLCGVQDVAVIHTYRTVPFDGVSIVVDGQDRMEGRSRFYDQIAVFRAGWNSEYEARSVDVKRVGQFWAPGNTKETIHCRTYDFWGGPVEIRIADEVDVGVADRVIGRIAAKDVHYRENGRSAKPRFERLVKSGSIPTLIEMQDSDGLFAISFEDGDFGGRRLSFWLEGDAVVIRNVGFVNY